MSADVDINTPSICTDNQDINDNIDISLSDRLELEVYIEPREYKVVGDDVYIPINFDSAPTWLTQAITDLTNIKVTDVVTNLNAMINDLTYAVQQVEVAKNQYEQSIVALNDIDSRFNSLLTTLNSNMDGLDASLKDLIATKVTSTQASVVALNAITTAMNDTSTGSTLGSAILNLQTSITNLNTSTNTSIESLESSINGAVDASAQAIETINTYVGIDGAGASTNTGLSAYLEDSTGNIGGADSNVTNNVYVDGLGNTRSKFEYNSNLSYNGYNYQSGFGLATTLTDSSIPVGESEFWINASKFKFTNTNQTGQVAPFTIDATGTTPQIKFNGVVSFDNVTDVPQLGTTPQEVVTAINNIQTTTINGPRITTGSITANQIAANTITSDKISTYNLTAANATFANSIITNATIANAAITNAKIGDAQITTAKIGDAQITNAKITDLSVSTLKIQDEAVIVPRISTGISAILYYTPNITHNALVIYYAPRFYSESFMCYLNGSVVGSSTSGYVQVFTTFYAGTSYSMQAIASMSYGGDGNPSYFTTQVFMLGVKK